MNGYNLNPVLKKKKEKTKNYIHQGGEKQTNKPGNLFAIKYIHQQKCDKDKTQTPSWKGPELPL